MRRRLPGLTHLRRCPAPRAGAVSWCIALCTSLLLALAAPVAAQPLGGPLNPGVVRSPVLVIDFERVFAESRFGQLFNAEIEQQGAALVAENRRIEAELTEEEQQLTEQRATLDAATFRSLADAFDEKVQRLRAEQDAKATALGARTEERQRAFLQVAQPVLESLMREANAAVILERRSVFVAADAVDITDVAIARINAQLDRQSQQGPVAPAPQQTPPEAPAPDPTATPESPQAQTPTLRNNSETD